MMPTIINKMFRLVSYAYHQYNNYKKKKQDHNFSYPPWKLILEKICKVVSPLILPYPTLCLKFQQISGDL